MLVYDYRLIGTPILSVRDGGTIGSISDLIIDPNNLKVIALRLNGPGIPIAANFLDTASVREYSSLGIVIDSTDELFSAEEVIKVADVLKLNFHLINLKVETKKGTKLGQITSYTIDSDSFIIQQIIVKRPLVKRLADPELTISRKEIIEVTNQKVIVKDEEKVLKERAEKEDFIPNFVNPFRTNPGFASSDTEEQN